MKSTTAFGLGIAVGYWLYRDRYDIRAYKKRIEELEKENHALQNTTGVYSLANWIAQKENGMASDTILRNKN